MVVCQICQHENPAGAEYCEDCGAALAVPVGAASGAAAGSAGAGAMTDGSTAASGPAAGSSPAPAAGDGAQPALPSVDAGTPAAAPDAGVVADAPAGADPARTDVAEATTPSTTSVAGSAPASASAPPAEGAPSTGQRPRLLALRYGAPTGDEIPLLGQRLVVGRFDPETGPVDIDLSEAAESVHISRQHGELYREADGRWMVRDLGSTNGVFVKGAADAAFGPRITAPRALTDGDEVAFGNARFVFRTA